MKKYNIVVDAKILEFWINKYIANVGFDKAKLNEIQEKALFDLEILSLYLTDKDGARKKFDESDFSEVEGVWEGIEKRAEVVGPESVHGEIDLINKKGVAWYLFSSQVEFICQVEDMMNIIAPTGIEDCHSLNWEQYKNKQLHRFHKYLIEEIEAGKSIIFYDKQLKINVSEYIEGLLCYSM